MDTERDKKALKAFWCMFDSAEKDRREVFYYKNNIQIYKINKHFYKRAKSIVGCIKFKEEIEEIVTKRFLGFAVDWEDVVVDVKVYGEVTNTKDGVVHYFGLSGDDARQQKDKILLKIKEDEEKRKIEEEKSLNELIC